MATKKEKPVNKFLLPICKTHKPMNTQLGYVAWNDWADRKVRMGHIQRECPTCGRLFFKCEY